MVEYDSYESWYHVEYDLNIPNSHPDYLDPDYVKRSRDIMPYLSDDEIKALMLQDVYLCSNCLEKIDMGLMD